MLRACTENQLVEQHDAGADVSAWERGMSQQVHALSGLTPEEIQIVEGTAK